MIWRFKPLVSVPGKTEADSTTAGLSRLEQFFRMLYASEFFTEVASFVPLLLPNDYSSCSNSLSCSTLMPLPNFTFVGYKSWGMRN